MIWVIWVAENSPAVGGIGGMGNSEMDGNAGNERDEGDKTKGPGPRDGLANHRHSAHPSVFLIFRSVSG